MLIKKSWCYGIFDGSLSSLFSDRGRDAGISFRFSRLRVSNDQLVCIEECVDIYIFSIFLGPLSSYVIYNGILLKTYC